MRIAKLLIITTLCGLGVSGCGVNPNSPVAISNEISGAQNGLTAAIKLSELAIQTHKLSGTAESQIEAVENTLAYDIGAAKADYEAGNSTQLSVDLTVMNTTASQLTTLLTPYTPAATTAPK